MKTKTIDVYTYDELTPKAKDRALMSWRDGNEYFFLGDNLNERLHELLTARGIYDKNDTSKPGTKPTQVLYSLSYSQGDGACFEGEFTYRDITAYVRKIDHHYSHKNTVAIECQETENLGWHIDEEEPLNEQVEEFEKHYSEICDALESYGYDYIKDEDSEENFIETCEANGYTFREDGTMENI